jgi:Spy/CpxP family protein refolding chaperone
MRNALTHWKAASYLAAIFVAGAVSGWMVSGKFARHTPSAPPRMDEMASALRTCMHGRLNLTAEQQPKVDAIIEKSSREMQTVHGENMKRIRQVMSNRTAQLNAILTPEQQAQFAQIEKERWEMLRNKDRDRDKDRDKDRDRDKWRGHGAPWREKNERGERTERERRERASNSSPAQASAPAETNSVP